MVSSNKGLIRPYIVCLQLYLEQLMFLSSSVHSLIMAWILNTPWHSYFTIAGFTAIYIYIITAEITALYASWRLGSLIDENKQLMITWIAVIFALLILAYVTKTSSIYSRRVLLSWMVVTSIVLSLFRLATRLVLRELRLRNKNMRKAAVVGSGSQAMHLVEELEKQPWSGIDIEGYYDKELPVGQQPDKDSDLCILGNNLDLIKKVKKNEIGIGIGIVFIALPVIREEEIKELIIGLSDSTVITYIVPDLFISELLNTRLGLHGEYT